MDKYLIVRKTNESSQNSDSLKANVKVNIAMVGSRNFTNFNLFEQKVDEAFDNWGLKKNNVNRIVSGGARGTDTLAEKYAKKYNIELKTYLPDWKRNGKAAGIIRNADIINNSDYVIAFPSHHGRGTQDSIRKAKKSNPPKKVHLYYID